MPPFIIICGSFLLATARLDDDLAGYFEKQENAVEAAAAAEGSKAAEPAQTGEEKKE